MSNSRTTTEVTRENMLKLIKIGDKLTYNGIEYIAKHKKVTRPGSSKVVDGKKVYLYYINLHLDDSTNLTSQEGYFLEDLMPFLQPQDEIEQAIGSGEFKKLTKKLNEVIPPVSLTAIELDGALESDTYYQASLEVAQQQIRVGDYVGYVVKAANVDSLRKIVQKDFKLEPDNQRYSIIVTDEEGPVDYYTKLTLDLREVSTIIQVNDTLTDNTGTRTVTEKKFVAANSGSGFELSITLS